MTPSRLLALLSLLAALPLAAGPGPGHDHDHDHDAPAAPAAAAAPRFVAQSELFELVGVLEGRRLSLYLDRAPSNEPLPAARIELELAGTALAPRAQPDGSFAVELEKAPGAGLHAVTATVTVGEDADLLAAELEVSGDAAAPGHAPWAWRRWAIAALLGLAGLAAGGVMLRRARARGFGGTAA